jgi:hypothetical protein
MAEDFDQRLEQVGFAGGVLAVKDIDEAVTVKFQNKVFEVLY